MTYKIYERMLFYLREYFELPDFIVICPFHFEISGHQLFPLQPI